MAPRSCGMPSSWRRRRWGCPVHLAKVTVTVAGEVTPWRGAFPGWDQRLNCGPGDAYLVRLIQIWNHFLLFFIVVQNSREWLRHKWKITSIQQQQCWEIQLENTMWNTPVCILCLVAVAVHVLRSCTKTVWTFRLLARYYQRTIMILSTNHDQPSRTMMKHHSAILTFVNRHEASISPSNLNHDLQPW